RAHRADRGRPRPALRAVPVPGRRRRSHRGAPRHDLRRGGAGRPAGRPGLTGSLRPVDSPEERLAAGGIHHVDAAALDAALAARPARPVLRCGTNAEVDAVLADPPAPLQGPQLADLEALAARLQRAEQVVARTRRRVRADTEARLASSTALAVHPETVRARADAVLRAREALVAAERELAQLAVPDE